MALEFFITQRQWQKKILGDRVASSPCSISMQAWGAPVSTFKLLFKALQVMQFCLRTEFGELEELYVGHT